MNHPLSYSRYCRLTFFIYGEIGSHSLVPNLALCNPSDLGYPNKDKIFPQKPLSSLFLSRTCHPSPKGTLYHYPFEGDTKSVVIYNTDGSLSESFTYGEDYGRLLSSTKRIPDKTFTNSYTYDWYGRPWTRTYPSGFKITYSYTQNGDLEKIYGDGQTIWECDDVNVLGQITDYSQGSYSTTVDYDEFGKLEEVTTGSVFNMLYSFDDAGNLESREDYLTSQKEEFSYDDLNRLTGIDYYLNSSHTTAGDLDLTYDNGGNITSKSDLASNVNYGETGHGYAGPHALTSIEDPVSAYKPPPQVINYTCFNKVSTIQDTIGQDTTLTLAFTYGLNNQRVKTVLSRNAAVERIKYFAGDYEEDSTSSGTKKYHYINSPTGLIGIFVKQGSADTLYHVLSDHLGSLNGVINAETDSVTYYSYTAWGIPRNADDWTSSFEGELFAGRGYTGHEHLLEFNLINMNGRVYDPVLGRFLSPDPYVQAPGYAGSFNRYAYCLNNPLIYSDPDGEFWHLIIGAAIGGYSGYKIGKAAGAEGWGLFWYTLGGAAIGGVAGQVGATVFANAMTAASAAGMGGFSAGANAGLLSGLAAGAINGGGTALLKGGDFSDVMAGATIGGWTGAVGGALMGGVSEGIRGLRMGGSFRNGRQEYTDLLASMDGGGNINPADLEANTIEWANEKGLIELGNNPSEVLRDVQTYDKNHPLYTKLSRLENAERYVSGWRKALTLSDPFHRVFQSPRLSNSPFVLKYYPTKMGYKNALGIVWKNPIIHSSNAYWETIENIKYFNDDQIIDMHYRNSRSFLLWLFAH